LFSFEYDNNEFILVKVVSVRNYIEFFQSIIITASFNTITIYTSKRESFDIYDWTKIIDKNLKHDEFLLLSRFY